jgi:hypothetical protein
MEKTVHLRRQAALCLSLSQFSLDPLIADHLSCLAAAFHEGALRCELESELGRDSTEGSKAMLLH